MANPTPDKDKPEENPSGPKFRDSGTPPHITPGLPGIPRQRDKRAS